MDRVKILEKRMRKFYGQPVDDCNILIGFDNGEVLTMSIEEADRYCMEGEGRHNPMIEYVVDENGYLKHWCDFLFCCCRDDDSKENNYPEWYRKKVRRIWDEY